MSLTVCCAIHNTDLTMFKKMLQSLLQHAPEMTQLIIIDNNSESKLYFSVLNHEIQHKEVLVLIQDKNIGFGRVHNLATLRATGEYIAYINDDVEFFETWSTPMIDILKDQPRIKQVGMKYDTCGGVDVYGNGYQLREGEDPDYIEASCMLMRTSDALEYGPFDDVYQFAYFEDTDLSLRIKRNGYGIALIRCNWKHYRAVTSEKCEDDIKGYHALNRYTFQKRWMSYLAAKKFGKCIVVRRTGSIGDVFLTLPVLKVLREQNPDAAIILATSTPQAVMHSSLIDLITNQPHAPIACDLFIDLDNTYEANYNKNIVDIYAEKAGVSVSKKRENFSASTTTVDKIKKLITLGEPYVALELSATWQVKQWAYNNYAELAERLTNKGYKVVLFGVCDYRPQKFIKCDKDFVNQLDITETGVLLSAMKCFIGHEGLSLHLAQASNVHSIGLYGCQLPEYTNDTSSTTLHPVISPAKCVGCRHRYCAGNMVLCPREGECMKMITVSTVFDKFCEVMEIIG